MTTNAHESPRISEATWQRHITDLCGSGSEASEATMSPDAGGENNPATDEPAREPALFISGPLFRKRSIMAAKKTTTSKKTTRTATPKKKVATKTATPAKSTAKKAAPKATKADTPTPKKLSALDAAAKVLAESKEPMRAKELIDAMAAKGYWTSPGGKTPHATLYAAILREINSKGDDARFTKRDRGLFAKNG